MAETKKTPRRTEATTGFTAEETAAMKDRAKELKAERKGAGKAGGLADLQAKIAELTEPDRSMAGRLHDLITEAVPELAPRTWYGMPAWAKDGKVLCFFQPATKFKIRYATFGFSEEAALDEGTMWPTSWALATLTPDDERALIALVRRAAS